MQVTTTTDTIDRVLLVRSVERRQTRDGSPFLRMMLGDRSGSLPAVLWDADGAAVAAAEHGAAVHVTGRVAEHPRYGRQVTIDALSRPAADAIPWTKLLDGPERPVGELCDDLERLVGSGRNPVLAQRLAPPLDPHTPPGRADRVGPAGQLKPHPS